MTDRVVCQQWSTVANFIFYFTDNTSDSGHDQKKPKKSKRSDEERKKRKKEKKKKKEKDKEDKGEEIRVCV